jgi:hypothetical protein
MERGSEIENTQAVIVKLKQQMSGWESGLQSIYIPLQGAYTTNSEEKSFDLTGKLKEFFEFKEDNPSDPRVMLLLGDWGSGNVKPPITIPVKSRHPSCLASHILPRRHITQRQVRPLSIIHLHPFLRYFPCLL